MPQWRSCFNWKLAVDLFNPMNTSPKTTFGYKKTKCILRLNSMTYNISTCSGSSCSMRNHWQANKKFRSIFFHLLRGHLSSQSLEVFCRFEKEKSLLCSPVLKKRIVDQGNTLLKHSWETWHSLPLIHIFIFKAVSNSKYKKKDMLFLFFSVRTRIWDMIFLLMLTLWRFQ